MMKKELRFEIVNYINHLTAIVFCYNIATTSLNIPINIKKYYLFENYIGLKNNNFINNESYNDPHQQSVVSKIYSDLYFHKLLHYKEDKNITQVSINKEGKILGYKPTKLRLISYPIEKQIINLLKKNKFMFRDNKSVYWLNFNQ